MPIPSDWRLPSSADALKELDRAGFAWEFLRRNPRYRHDYEQLPDDATLDALSAVGERWGLSFACNPDLTANEALVLWRPELLATGITLVAAPPRFPDARRLESHALSRATVDLHNRDGRHVMLTNRKGNHHLWLPEALQDAPLAALVPLDNTASIRLGSLKRLMRDFAGKSTGPLPPAWQITPRLHRRLILMLRALDGHLESASYREVATALFGSEAVSRYPWKTSSLRDQAIRLVHDGVATMNGGYRKLLRGER
jgi:hypothetical protein